MSRPRMLNGGIEEDLRTIGNAARSLAGKVVNGVKHRMNPNTQLIQILTSRYDALINEGQSEAQAKKVVIAWAKGALEDGISLRKATQKEGGPDVKGGTGDES